MQSGVQKIDDSLCASLAKASLKCEFQRHSYIMTAICMLPAFQPMKLARKNCNDDLNAYLVDLYASVYVITSKL